VDQFEGSLNDLRRFANAVGDSSLIKRIVAAEKRFKELQEAEARAVEIAERERAAREEAEVRARAAEAARISAEREKATAERALVEEKKRTLFLTSVSSLDIETVTNLHHQVIICAADIDALIELQLDRLNTKKVIDRESLFSFLEEMRLKNQQVLAIARMATKANFRMDSDEITADIAAFFAQYLQNIASNYHRVKIDVTQPQRSFEIMFKPIEVSIIIDNLVSNARKADSPSLDVGFEWKSKSVLQVTFTDYGRGLDTIFTDPNYMFEKGVSTTEGSGLGLYHTRQIVESMGGTIEYEKPGHQGARFIVTLPKSK
jgi:signal transduction histidine kinase